ncbi:MAG: hypothetical protein AB7E60_06570 [Sphingobium sp.]
MLYPTAEQTLAACAAELTEMAPHIQPAYRGAVLTYVATLLKTASESWDGAAHLLVQENRALRALFVRIAPVIADDTLAARLAGLQQGEDEDLRISALLATNETLRAALIDAQIAIEDSEGAEARAAEDDIWSELRASTERRCHSGDMYY